MTDGLVLVALGGLALLALLLGVGLLRMRSRTRRELHAAQAEAAQLRARIDEIEHRLAAPAARADAADRSDVAEYTITDLGRVEPTADDEPASIDRALFADLVLRETVVRVASVAHGVRRALAPETRNRIRFEVRREIRRSRKQRKADLREARREWEARQRDGLPDDPADDPADDRADDRADEQAEQTAQTGNSGDENAA